MTGCRFSKPPLSSLMFTHGSFKPRLLLHLWNHIRNLVNGSVRSPTDQGK